MEIIHRCCCGIDVHAREHPSRAIMFSVRPIRRQVHTVP